jgi:pyruvate dehydrogenase E2 component (dihydrolipoamide acetyltransferase)
MATDIVIPKLGMTMASAKVVEWKATEGDWITQGQCVLVIETEKVTCEVEALANGFLHVLMGPGSVAKVHETVGQLAETKEELEKLQIAQPSPIDLPVTTTSQATTLQKTASGGRLKITPLAKKIAGEHGLDYTRVKGTGPGGRIKKEDIIKAIEESIREPLIDAAITTPAWNGEVVDGKRVKASLPLTGMRAAVADHMQASLAGSAQISTMGEFEVGTLVELRQSLVRAEAKIGTRISYTDVLIYILARALKKYPIMNSSVVDREIKIWEDINIGVAVSLPFHEYDAGLIVPVIRNADKKTLTEVSVALKALRARCIEGTIGLEEISGGTFTLSNTGGFGKGYAFNTPIINRPQAAILGTGAIVERPMAEAGEVVIRQIMNFSLTFDHRIINGAPVGMFLGTIQEFIDTPGLLLA